MASRSSHPFDPPTPQKAPRYRARKHSSFPVVCIGLSAGGIAPLKELFSQLSPTTGMAFVVIHHVRKIPTLIPEILAACTTMPVLLASAGVKLKPGQVYVLPSGKELAVTDNSFALRTRTKTTGFTNVFTLLLNSISESHHPAIAVVLSGIDEDGAAALERFHQNGGIIVAQAPRTAEREEMPVAAMETGYVNQVLAPHSIAAELEEIARTLNVNSSIGQKMTQIGAGTGFTR